MWQFEGLKDRTRVSVGDQARFERDALDVMTNELCGGTNGYESPSPGVHALYSDTDNRDAILASMPMCTEFGIASDWMLPQDYGQLLLHTGDDSDSTSDEEGFLVAPPGSSATGASTSSHASGSNPTIDRG